MDDHIAPLPITTISDDSSLPLAQQAANILRDMIVQDIIPPGKPIRERTLAQQLNVSRTPLREALRILAVDGLVELLPSRGAIAANPSPEDVKHMLEFLGGIEGLAGELACNRATDEEIDEIRALHYEMLAAFARKDRLTYFKLNQRIHRALVLASGNPLLIETHERTNARLYRIRYRSNMRNTKWPTAISEHEEILKAIESRDAIKLNDLLRNHLDSTWTKVSEDGQVREDNHHDNDQ
ncbi:GntR family transcriptional regulator [Thalassospira povalilytica]|uniref:GntR family transcriptional regulator n=2 Tax=Pseudomonadota TaxID=1224 RepID=UPI003AA83002